MVNPFQIDPTAGYDPNAMARAGQSLKGLGAILGEKREKTAALESQKQMQADMEAVISGGNPAEISAFMRKNPEQADLIKQTMDAEGEMVQEEATSFLTDILTTPEDQWFPKLKQRIDTVEGRGGDPRHSLKLIEAFANDPKQAKGIAETLLSTFGTPGSFEAYQAATAEEIELSPLQKKIAAEGIDPNTPEGYARAKELNQRAATDPSLAPSDQNILKDANNEQMLSAGFAARVSSANELLTDLESSKDFDPSSLGASIARDVPGGNYVISPQHQEYFQAKDNFITAVLRRESGAAIGADEYVREDKKYFPQPGDSKSVMKQKAKSRKRAFDNLRNASKGVYDVQKRNPNLYGAGDAQAVTTQAQYDALPSGSVYLEDGVEYRKP